MRYLAIACVLIVGCDGGEPPDDMCRINAHCTPLDGPPPIDAGAGPDGSTPDGPPATADQALCDAINQYRAQNGLGAIPTSAGLGRVARFHVEDLEANQPAAGCNLHSWSFADPRWTGCCYTPDHAQAQCMWDKPREISSYSSAGYEISAGGGGGITPAQAISLWNGSPGHRDVILNAGTWANRTWRGIGCAIEGGHANVWFGELAGQ